jgi:hypothetical protein
LKADIGGDADLAQLGTLLYDETRYQDALVALPRRPRRTIRSRFGGAQGDRSHRTQGCEFIRARQEAEELLKPQATIPKRGPPRTRCGPTVCSMKRA